LGQGELCVIKREPKANLWVQAHTTQIIKEQDGLRILTTLNPHLVPLLTHLALDDPSIDVRTAATWRLNDFVGQRFLILRDEQIRGWWETQGKQQFDNK